MKRKEKRKKKRVFKKSLKGLVSLLLALLVCVYSFLADWSLDTAYADNATDRITTFINLAKGQSIVDEAGNVANLTEDELQFLGVYISNFFVPFGTELGTSADNEDTINQMSEALSKNMSWSEDTAKLLCEKILGLSRSNDKELKIYASKGYMTGEYTEITDMDCNYFNFLRLMLGDWRDVDYGYKVSGNAKLSRYHFVYFCYQGSDGNPVPVFDASLRDNILTSSQVAFRDLWGSLQLEKGFGFSFFDLTQEECETEDLSNMNATDEEFMGLSIYGDKMYVDCFGNIIKKGKVHQYIGVPACMNPYTWIAVDEDGNDWGQAGLCLNMINFPLMGLSDSDELLFSNRFHTTSGMGILDCYTLEDYISDGGFITDISWAGTNESLAGLQQQGTSKGSYQITVEKNGKKSKALHTAMYPKLNGDNVNPIITSREYEHGWIFKAEGNYIGAALRIQRGSTEYLLTSNGAHIGSVDNLEESWKNAIKKAEDAFKSNNSNDKSYYMSYVGGVDYPNKTDFTDFIGSDADKNASLMAESSAVFVSSSSNSAILYQYETHSNDGSFGPSSDNGNASLNAVYMLDGMVFIDNLGAFNSENGGSTDFSTINFSNYLDESLQSSNKLLDSYSSDPNNGYSTTFSDIQSGKMSTNINVSEAATSSVYTSYLIASLYKNDAQSKKDTIGKLGFKLNSAGLPSIENAPIELSEEYQVDIMNDAIRNWTYYLLHPTKGLKYVKTLVKNKSQAILVDWHNDMVGTNDVGATTGTTTYRSNMGYVTTPDLTEISWASKALNVYGKCIPYLILAMIILMLFTYIIGIMPLQKAAFGVIIFSVFLFLPPVIINSVVSISNNVVQKIYGSRFTYWAVVQQESYAGALDDAITADSYDNYLRSLYALNSETYNNQGGDSIVLKWQAPKKSTSLIFTERDSEVLNGLRSSDLVSYALNRNTMSGQNFTDEDNSYLYRSYTDLSNTSRFTYQGIDLGNVPSKTLSQSGILYTNDTTDSSKSMEERISSIITNYSSYVDAGYSNPLKENSTNMGDAVRLRTPVESNIYDDACKLDLSSIKSLNYETAPGINQDVFNYSLPVFNNASLSFTDVLKVQNNATQGNYSALIRLLTQEYGMDESTTNQDFEKEMTSLASYALMSESSYYYFSWCLYDQGMSYRSGVKNGYKTLLLSGKDGSFFYNTKGNGELKDFMDMRTLFTVIIPYLKKGNDLVREFDDKYGLELYDGVPTEEGHWEDAGMLDSNGKPTELYKKYWHNVAVARLYEIYTPWVDLMYDCNYAKSEDISVMGKTYTIEDPLDPMCYPEDRPMIFSASEMYDYGLDEADLTEVERRILKTNEGMCDRMFELLNYVTFRDSTLNSAAALECAFEFNSNFSQESITGNNTVIYPQTYEINNFSYDAYLRFILANTTGDDLSASDDFYLTVVKKSSTTTAIMLIVNDIISQYVFQGFKIFFLVAVFVASVLLIIVTAFKIDTDQKYIKKLLKGIAIPLIGFLVVNIIFAGVLAMFMGVGNNAVTQTSRATIQTGDPVIVMLIMIALDILCMVCYFKLVKAVIKEIMSNLNLIKGYLGGIAQGTVAFAGGITSKLSNIGKGNGGGSGAYGSNPSEGRVSARADRRASSHNDVDSFSEDSDIRRNEAQRETFKQSEANIKGKNGSEKDINQKIDSGERKLKEGNQTEDRRVREGGYAGRSMENLSEGASESMKNISHGASKSIENLSEGLSSMMKSSGKSAEHLSKGAGKSMENSSEALKNMTKKGK